MTQEEIETAALVSQLNFGKPEVLILMPPFTKHIGRVSKRRLRKMFTLWHKQLLRGEIKLKRNLNYPYWG